MAADAVSLRAAIVSLAVAAACLSLWVSAADDAPPAFSDEDIARILRHGPWPVAMPPDPSNRVSGKPAAIDLGERLFFDTRLSHGDLYSCGTCHMPERSWTDGDKVGEAFAKVDRNTPAVLNQRLNRWFGLDGGGDSLWAQSVRPMLDERELRSNPQRVAGLLRGDRDYACRYAKAFGRTASADDEALLVDAAKALAAFQETLVSARTSFDDFRDALARGDREAAARYPAAAQRGLKIFIGKGDCTVCHVGPNFTNGEFHDIGVPFFIGLGRVDAGRYDGIKKLRENKFNLLGKYNDDAARSSATSTVHVAREQRNYGEFKVPSLRNVALTAPYMHNGRYATLREVVNHYSELNEDRLHADGERILKPLKLSEREATDLVAFLESLSEREPRWRRKSPRAGPACE